MVEIRYPTYRIAVSTSITTSAQEILGHLPSIGISGPAGLRVLRLYFFEGDLSERRLRELAALVCDPVTESLRCERLPDPGQVNGLPLFEIGQPDIAPYNYWPTDPVLSKPSMIHSGLAGMNQHILEVALRPGVTDNTASELLGAGRNTLGIRELQSVATGRRFEFVGDLQDQDIHRIARSLLVNETIERYTLGEILPEFIHPSLEVSVPETICLYGLNAEELLALSRDRRLALDLAEMQAIQAYFQEQGRNPTDAELETLAQTWSEHCVHKTFRALINLEDGGSVDGLLKTYIQSATRLIAAPWVRSAFVDNAGVIEFDDTYDISFKVETHNHPSAIEPFGGANTGVGGVVRDILGVSHRPIANTDVLCFGPADAGLETLLPGVLHPARIRAGVVAGVQDYGNKLGLPTVNGAVLYHPGYTANPLVYCGCVGLGRRDIHPRTPQVGDRAIVIGGRTGRDGLRGATFSSLAMDAQTGEVAGSAVQIGDPITEKGVIEVVARASEAGLYHAITDCGAGGLSSAVGEMSSTCGVEVDLAKAPLKYSGLAPWEIWLSEAQERMVLAVPPENLPALADLCALYWVEWSDLGVFTDSGRLQVRYGDLQVVDLENEFLHHGMPRLFLSAKPPESGFIKRSDEQPKPPNRPFPHPDPAQAIHAAFNGSDKDRAGEGAALGEYESLLIELLSHPGIASKEGIIRVYDHEVGGGTVVRPLAGVRGDGPSDAAVLKPLQTGGWRGLVLSNGINPFIGEVDPYAMAVSVVDEAIRNAIAVGADPDRLALLDNFCWGDPRRPETLWSLVRAAQGCHEAALHYGTPFISGKDSLNNEWVGADGQRHAIPGTLLISAIAIHPDVRAAVTMDLKTPGDRLYLVGDWTPALAGSHTYNLRGEAYFGNTPAAGRAPGLVSGAPQLYRALHAALLAGLARAAHDLSEGGLAVAAAEMCLAGRLGLRIDLSALHPDPRLALFAETNSCLLVEVPPDFAEEFERRMKPTGSYHWLCLDLGQVIDASTAELQIVHGGELIVQAPVNHLASAFSFSS